MALVHASEDGVRLNGQWANEWFAVSLMPAESLPGKHRRCGMARWTIWRCGYHRVVVPTSGALVRVDIETDARKRLCWNDARRWRFIPLAADVQDSAGSSVGTVGEAGIAHIARHG
ncbi:hypothetical protein [Citrobacter freundii]|uniref:hypothetical protein n=1 Tax=Citrobacter freundii TaxID=546 RepID=UPI001FFE0D84|nr:hypothetical protein [Citrobacter freundii]